MNNLIWIFRLVTIAIALAFVASVLQSCRNCDDVTVSYTEEESYDEEVVVKDTLSYEIISDGVQVTRSPGYTLFGTNPRITISKLVRNTSSFSGTFTLTGVITSGSDRAAVFGTRDIAAGQSVELEASTEVTPYTFQDVDTYEVDQVEIISPTIERTEVVTKIREVKKFRKCNPCQEDCLSQ